MVLYIAIIQFPSRVLAFLSLQTGNACFEPFQSLLRAVLHVVYRCKFEKGLYFARLDFNALLIGHNCEVVVLNLDVQSGQ